MKRIGLLSDTHSHMDDGILGCLTQVDEIWHAGDIGDPSVVGQLAALKPLRAVYGNIDATLLRQRYPEDLWWEMEGVRIFMTHIGGYPGRYQPRVRSLIAQRRPDLFICGHSHILKVMPDAQYSLLHINPGACGHHGFHIVRTLVRFDLAEGRVHGLEVVELGRRGQPAGPQSSGS